MSPPWMPLYIADYKQDTGHLGAAEHGAYLLLIMHYWSRGSLPDDDRQLARIACMSPDEWSNARALLVAFFNDGWKHQRIEDELAKANFKHGRRVEAGKQGGEASARAKAQQSSSNATSNAQASSSQPQSDKESKKETRAMRASLLNPEFDEWWEGYQHKVGKSDALRAYRKARSSVEASTLLEGVKRYIAAKPPDRPWLNPATWLNGQHWLDVPADDQIKTREAIDERRSAYAASSRLDQLVNGGVGTASIFDQLASGSPGENNARMLPKN